MKPAPRQLQPDGATSGEKLIFNGSIWLPALKDNLNAVSSPTVNDDDLAGYQPGSHWINASASPADYYVCVDNTTGAAIWIDLTAMATGDVVGPASATDTAVALYNGTTGKLLKNSLVTVDGSGNLATPGTVDGLDVSAHDHGGGGGATVDHVDLSNKGTNTHAQIDTHLASTANPHATDIGNLGSGSLAELNAAITDATLDDITGARTPSSHASSHQDAGADEINVAGLSGELADAQPVAVSKNSGAIVGTRSEINFIEGTNITLSIADDPGNDEVDITITASGGAGDVVGPASSTDEALARFDLATGKLLQNGVVTEDDSGRLKSIKSLSFGAEYDAGNSTAAKTIEWTTNGENQKVTLTANCTFTFNAPPGVGWLTLKLVEDGTGGYTITLPGTVKMARGNKSVSIEPNDISIARFYYDGSVYYGQIARNFIVPS